VLLTRNFANMDVRRGAGRRGIVLNLEANATGKIELILEAPSLHYPDGGFGVSPSTQLLAYKIKFTDLVKYLLSAAQRRDEVHRLTPAADVLQYSPIRVADEIIYKKTRP
jgi:hypothetical protein